MQFLDRLWWLKVLVQGSGKRQIRQRQRVSPGCIERLESRQLLTTFVVTSTDDTTDAGTLRWAIEQANDSVGADTITFDSSFQTPRTIVLGGSQLPTLDDNTGPTNIAGPGTDLLTISGSFDSRILEVAANSVVLISGLTIREGRASDSRGGGILNSGILTLSNVHIADCSAQEWGGAIYNAGSLMISQSMISNSTAEFGGAIATRGSLTTSHVQFLGNFAERGGAIFSDGGTSVAFSVFEGNFVNSTYGDGGGIYQARFTTATPALSVTGSTFSNNSAARGGAISNYGFATIGGSTFHNNDAYNGGAIYNQESLALYNSTLVYNSAEFGGAIDNTAADFLELSNLTITGNSGIQGAAGIELNYSFASIKNSIVAGNLRDGVPDDIAGGLDNINVWNNLFGQSEWTSERDGVNGNIVLDPLDDIGLGPLADNGGFTMTMALLAGSPAIDHGESNIGFVNDLEFDQRGYGFRRNLGTHVDMGAFESNFPTTAVHVDENQYFVIDVNDNGLGNFPFTYALTGGADQGAFNFYAFGEGSLFFNTPPDFETPQDADHDNVYRVQVTITNSLGQTLVQDLSITVDDFIEPPVFTLASEAATYQGGTLLVAPDAEFTPEVGQTEFSHAELFIYQSQTRGPNDRLTIVSQGKKPGQIQVKKDKILYGGTEIGQLAILDQSNPMLHVTFNSQSTAAAIRAVVRRIGFSSRKNHGPQQPRTVSVQYFDDVNGHLVHPSRQINVVGKG